MLLKPSIYSTF